MKLLRKKGVISNLQAFIMSVVTIAVIIGIGLYVLQEVETSIEQASDSTYVGASDTPVTAGGNATRVMIQKLATTPTWIGLLIVVVFASAILAYFYFKG